MSDDDLDDEDSTLVREGKLAMGYKEMVAFVKDIEDRPTTRLVSDLEGLLALPEAKYQLVVIVLRKRTQPDVADRSALVGRLRYLQQHADDPTVRSLSLAFFEKPASQASQSRKTSLATGSSKVATEPVRISVGGHHG